MKKTDLAHYAPRRFRTRYSAVPSPGQALGGTSKTEPDHGISIADLLEKYSKPPVEPLYTPYTVPVFPRAMDFAEVQARADELAEQKRHIGNYVSEQIRQKAAEAAKAAAEKTAENARKAKQQKSETDVDE